MIRKQIKTCAIFIPVISRHTHERREGYFRLEWNLAVDRSRLISTTQAFLVPVVIDDTSEDDEEVPEKIRDVHWTRLSGGRTPPVFVERIQRLLSGESAGAAYHTPSGGSSVANAAPAPGRLIRRRMGLLYGAIAAVLFLSLGYLKMERLNRAKPSPSRAKAEMQASSTSRMGFRRI
jgi:hypothetical protein